MQVILLNSLDPQIKSHLVKMALIGLGLMVVTSITSFSFHHFDEHYQVIEFLSYKAGITSESALAWEFEKKAMAWLQPAFYYQLAKTLNHLNITNPFSWSLTFRLVTALMSWMTLVLMSLWVIHNIKNTSLVRLFIVIIFTLCFIPYLSVRTSSETFCRIFLTLGFLAFTLPKSNKSNEVILNKIKWLISGFCFGLSIAFRYQASFGVLGFLLWLLFFDESRIKSLVYVSMGVSVALLIGFLADHWGYGEWSLVPWTYFKIQILEGFINSFDVSPFWYYPILLTFHHTSPINLVLLIGIFAFWIRFFKHPITWITLSFFLAHCFVGHKEIRFLLPLLFLSLLACFKAYSHIIETPSYLSLKLSKWPSSKSFYFLVCFNFVALAFFSFFSVANSRHEVAVQKVIYQEVVDSPLFIYGQSPYEKAFLPRMTFYAPRDLKEIKLNSLTAISNSSSGFIMTDTIPRSREVTQTHPNAELIYRTLPAWLIKYNYFDWVSRTKIWSLFRLNN